MEIMESCVPPGFRFHPTEEELVGYYLNRKVTSQKIDLDVIIDIDLYRIEPWDIQGRCKLGYEEQNEWYFFSYKDRKFPTGTRTNRATAAGFWKATGRDKAVLSKERIIGMRKTLVFYKGRAPNGRKTDWIMHEYRLETTEHRPPQEEGWVVCRAFKKLSPSHQQQGFNTWNSYYHARSDRNSYRATSYPSIPSTTMSSNSNLHSGEINHINIHPLFPPETLKSSHNPFESPMVDIPKLDSPSISASFPMSERKFEHSSGVGNEDTEDEKSFLGDQYSEWKSLDGLLTSQVLVSTSYAYTTLGSKDDELDGENHMSHLLHTFSDI